MALLSARESAGQRLSNSKHEADQADFVSGCASEGQGHLQVFMLLLQRFQNDGNQLNVAIPDLVRHLVCRVAPVPPANTPRLLRLHVVLQLPVGGVNLLQKLRPAVVLTIHQPQQLLC